MATPSGEKTKETPKLKVTSSFFDLDSFESVGVYKEQEFQTVDSLESALARVGNDNARLIAVVNKGLESEAKKEMRQSLDGWLTVEDDEPYNGKPADEKKVGNFILTLAKTIFGYNKGMTKEQKRDAKTSARKMALESEQMRNGIAKNCALDLTEQED